MTVIVAGAGIGGLALALSLHQIDEDVLLCESVADIKPLGVGINLLPHATRELAELDLLAGLSAIAVKTSELCYYTKRGQHIWSEPRGLAAGYRWPQLSIHRGKLQMALLDAARERLPRERVLTGMHLHTWSQSNGRVTATFIDPVTGNAKAETDGDLLIACDGIHSTARAELHPDEGPPIWNGAILWRGTTFAPPFLSGSTMIMAGHEHQKFVCYPVTEADAKTGKALINWVAERKFPTDRVWRREDWNRAGVLEEFLPQFRDWAFDWLDVPALITSAAQVYEYPMVDRDPLSSWTSGRMTLLGDAAHPMYPIGSNGASQAILDARVLTREIQRLGPTEAALAAFEAERLPATSKIVLANRGNGPERVMQLVEERAPNGFDRLHDVISTEELSDVADTYKRIAGFDMEQLNARGPIVVASR